MSLFRTLPPISFLIHYFSKWYPLMPSKTELLLSLQERSFSFSRIFLRIFFCFNPLNFSSKGSWIELLWLFGCLQSFCLQFDTTSLWILFSQKLADKLTSWLLRGQHVHRFSGPQNRKDRKGHHSKGHLLCMKSWCKGSLFDFYSGIGVEAVRFHTFGRNFEVLHL